MSSFQINTAGTSQVLTTLASSSGHAFIVENFILTLTVIDPVSLANFPPEERRIRHNNYRHPFTRAVPCRIFHTCRPMRLYH